jgi:hypothetical protein
MEWMACLHSKWRQSKLGIGGSVSTHKTNCVTVGSNSEMLIDALHYMYKDTTKVGIKKF